MNKVPQNEIIIVDMSENIKVLVTSNDKKEKVKKIGFTDVDDSYMIYFVDDLQDKINKIKELINEEALFSYGIGWSPSELMSYYIELGFNFNKYKIISWSNKSTYHIIECDSKI
ncbi:hypothetical protein [Gilliamella sp. Pas-s25]|uniref:hypothetical protein n=1 Tax=Gilliamella sp. Pas-s25 TaxID=2687310 RepID=UPI00135E55B5|nr:hypothetical protein [Gilliamella sp. Pas-s25]MWP62728.1 hypothetical protein [Gilliamella sp. Pas-s25]